MVESSLLIDLVARWEAAREAGTPLTPEELCADCPEMLEPLRQALVKSHGLDAVSVSQPFEGATSSFLPPVPYASDDAANRCGEAVAGYTLVRELGHGGFGQVFEAEDPLLKRRVAIKFLHSKALQRPQAREQFLGEAQAMAALSNDHVVPIYHVGQHGMNLLLVMPLLAGETLAARLKRQGILPLPEFVRIARELAQGLLAIHAKGLIHRDLKPANIWLEAGTGRVKILDLGLAEEVTNLCQGGSAGTPAYMSPEQVEGKSLDFRSDLFSLGAVFYECLTARKAFPGNTINATINAVLRDTPIPLGQVNPATPPAMRQLVATLLEKDCTQRPVSAQAVLDALPLPSETSSVTPVDPPVAPVRRRWPWLVGGAGAAAVLLTAVLVWWMQRPQPSGPITEPPPTIPAASLAILDLEVTPLKPEADGYRPLEPLSKTTLPRISTNHCIEARARLSRLAYCYLVLHCSTGQSVLLFPRSAETPPPLTDQPRYPPRGETVAYQLDDGPGVWAVSVVASEKPLPSYRDWLVAHPNNPWKAELNANQLDRVLFDDGQNLDTPNAGGGFTRMSRGEKKAVKVLGRAQLEPLVDWWKSTSGGVVKVVAFPVQAK